MLLASSIDRFISVNGGVVHHHHDLAVLTALQPSDLGEGSKEKVLEDRTAYTALNYLNGHNLLIGDACQHAKCLAHLLVRLIALVMQHKHLGFGFKRFDRSDLCVCTKDGDIILFSVVNACCTFEVKLLQAIDEWLQVVNIATAFVSIFNQLFICLGMLT